MRCRVHWEGLDGIADGNEACRTAERRKRPCVRPATVETGPSSSGGVWRTAKRRKRTSYGRNRGPVDREGCGVPQNGGNGPPMVEMGVLLIWRGVAYRKTEETDLCWSATVETGVLFIRRGVATAKRDSTGYCSSPPSTSSSLHGLLFIQPPPHATPPATVQPPLHGHPCTVYCSSSPPRGPVHPPPTGSIGVLFIQWQRPLLPRGLVHPTPTGNCSSTSPATLIVHPEEASTGFS